MINSETEEAKALLEEAENLVEKFSEIPPLVIGDAAERLMSKDIRRFLVITINRAIGEVMAKCKDIQEGLTGE